MRRLLRSFLFCSAVFAPSLGGCGGDVTGSAAASDAGGGPATSGAGTGATGAGGGASTGTGTSATTSSTSATATGAGGAGGVGQGGAGGAPSAECAALAPLVLSDPTASPGWSPGEAGTIAVTLTNTGAVDLQYPGITVESDHPGVTSGNPTNYFFAMFPGTSMPLGVGFVADASLPSGTAVGFTIRVIDIQSVVCTNIDGISFQTTLN